MNQTLLIVAREMRQRLRKPSFWLLTLVVPLILASLYALPVWLASQQSEAVTVAVVDETGLFVDGLESNEAVHFTAVTTIDEARAKQQKGDAVLYIPLRQTTIPRDAFLLYRGSLPSAAVRNNVDAQLQTLLRNAILEDVYHLQPSIYHSVSTTDIRLHTQDATTGRENFASVKSVVALAMALLMAIALMLFGMQSMRAIQEEKQNRMAEVMGSTVRPQRLLVGKIGGVAATAIVQLALWFTLTAAALAGVQAASPKLFNQAKQQQTVQSVASKGNAATVQYNTPVHLVDQTVQGLTAIRLPLVAGVFFLFFLLGYLLYGTLAAALAARLDSDAEAPQWILLVGAPLLIAVALAPLVVRTPASVLGVWLLLTPFTAPVGAMLRLPFGLPLWQLGLSIALLLLCCIAAALLAARSYRRHLV